MTHGPIVAEVDILNSMLRIITQQIEVQTELRRIRDRPENGEMRATETSVREIFEAVKRWGDRALLDEFASLEPLLLNPQQLRVSGSELDAAYQQISKELLDALQIACHQLEGFHRQRLPKSWVQFGDHEIVVGKRYTPVKRAGIYISGEKKGSLGSVLKLAIPAKIAKVPQVIIVTPAGVDQKIAPAILVAAQEAGVDEIYRVGGVAAIAALAYGTQTIPAVETIVGSGDHSITLAKKMVYGTVTIDAPIDSSDLIIIGDQEANPVQLAADLLAQAEQNYTSALLLLTPDFQLAEKVQKEVQKQLKIYPQGILMEKALAHYGLIIVVDSLEEAAAISNDFAPQYLALEVAEPWELVEKIRHAGTIFLGNSTPKAVGDYLGGSSSIFPTVGVETFLKSSSLIQYSNIALKQMSNTLQILAQAEDLPASIEAIRLRIQAKKRDH